MFTRASMTTGSASEPLPRDASLAALTGRGSCDLATSINITQHFNLHC